MQMQMAYDNNAAIPRPHEREQHVINPKQYSALKYPMSIYKGSQQTSSPGNKSTSVKVTNQSSVSLVNKNDASGATSVAIFSGSGAAAGGGIRDDFGSYQRTKEKSSKHSKNAVTGKSH